MLLLFVIIEKVEEWQTGESRNASRSTDICLSNTRKFVALLPIVDIIACIRSCASRERVEGGASLFSVPLFYYCPGTVFATADRRKKNIKMGKVNVESALSYCTARVSHLFSLSNTSLSVWGVSSRRHDNGAILSLEPF